MENWKSDKFSLFFFRFWCAHNERLCRLSWTNAEKNRQWLENFQNHFSDFWIFNEIRSTKIVDQVPKLNWNLFKSKEKFTSQTHCLILSLFPFLKFWWNDFSDLFRLIVYFPPTTIPKFSHSNWNGKNVFH